MWQASLSSSLARVLFEGDSRPRRKLTFRIMFVLSLRVGTMSLGFSFSFPLAVLASAANSSTRYGGVGGSFFDRVAVRRLCSSVDRNL